METVRAVLGPEAPLMSLPAFVESYFSSQIDIDPGVVEQRKLATYLVAPTAGLKPLGKVDTARRQPLASLVDDAIFVLLQRRERLRGTKVQENRNVLCQGYAIPNDFGDLKTCSRINAAVVMTRINHNVLFWKTNPTCRLLHESLGDEFIRTMLIHTSMFVPLVDGDSAERPSQGNYMQICGPLCRPRIMQPPEASPRRKHRKRRRPMASAPPGFECLHPHARVPNKGLFYSSAFVPVVSLPANHILNGPGDAELLLKSMIGRHFNDRLSRRQRRRWKGLCESGLSICEIVFQRHKSCDYHRLLDRFCPLPGLLSQSEISLAEAAAAHTPVVGVVGFLSTALKHVIPLVLLGSSHNLDRLVHHAGSFVRLRRQECLVNKSIMHGMKVTHIPWLFATSSDKVHRMDHHTANALLLRVLRWIFTQFIVPLLASVFHITESEMSGKQVLYYRKPVWSVFRSLSMKKLLKQQYTEVSADEAAERLRAQRMGFSRLRLLPKESGVRPIATLCKQEAFRLPSQGHLVVASQEVDDDEEEEIETPFFEAYKRRRIMPTPPVTGVGNKLSTNRILDNAFLVLRYEYLSQQELFGVGMDGLPYFHTRYRAFVEHLQSNHFGKPVYFVSVDIQHAYDSINQHHLLSIVENLLSQHEYCIQRCDVLHPFASLGRIVKRPRRKVGPSESMDALYRSIENEFRQSILVDSSNICIARKSQLLKELTEHLKSHLVTIRGRYGDRYLVQSTGIPQGSVLSTILCNFYYGAFERKYLSEFLQSMSLTQAEHAGLLVRMVDDFMLATTNYSLATRFLEKMRIGNESWGVSINREKTKVSAAVYVGDDAVFHGVEMGSGFFPWCGMLFDLKSCAVRIDYSRLVSDDVGDSLTVDRGGHEGQRFLSALKMFIRPRCIPILFDPTINDALTQMINFCQMFVFCAAKALTYLQISDMRPASGSNMDFLVAAIESTIKYGYNLISNRLEKASGSPKLGFSRPVALTLAWTACHDVFRQNSEFDELARICRKKAPPSDPHGTVREAIVGAMDSPGIKKLFPKKSLTQSI